MPSSHCFYEVGEYRGSHVYARQPTRACVLLLGPSTSTRDTCRKQVPGLVQDVVQDTRVWSMAAYPVSRTLKHDHLHIPLLYRRPPALGQAGKPQPRAKQDRRRQWPHELQAQERRHMRSNHRADHHRICTHVDLALY